ncbi:MAG: hypothetical protein IJ807_00175 [Eubacterium sp.]|nr:hypothetical protein [Eubacterium sp.]
MKTLSRSTAIVLAFALGLSGVAGNLLMPANDSQAAVRVPTISEKKITLKAGKKKTFKIRNIKKKQVASLKVTSSSKKTVKVVKKGLTGFVVTALKKGRSTITANLKLKKAIKNKKSYRLKLSVRVTRPVSSSTAEPGQDISVSTQKELDLALKQISGSSSEGRLVINDKATNITIPEGDYSKTELVVNAPNADILNNGRFKRIEIDAIAKDTFTENAKGNIFLIKAGAGRVVILKNAIIKECVIISDNSDFVIDVQGKADSIVLDSNTSAHINVSGVVSEVKVNSAASVEITGTTSSAVPIDITAEAKGAKIVSEVAVDVNAKSESSIILNKGAEKSTIKSETTESTVELTNNTSSSVSVTTSQGEEKSVPSGKKAEVAGNGDIKQSDASPVIAPPVSPIQPVVSRKLTFTHKDTKLSDVTDLERISIKEDTQDDNYLYISLENNCPYSISVDAVIHFYRSGVEISDDDDGFSCVYKMTDFVLCFYNPEDSYDAYEVEIDTCEINSDTLVGHDVVKTSLSRSQDTTVLKVENGSDRDIQATCIQITKRKNGRFVGVQFFVCRDILHGGSSSVYVDRGDYDALETDVIYTYLSKANTAIDPTGANVQFKSNSAEVSIAIKELSAEGGGSIIEIKNNESKAIIIKDAVLYFFNSGTMVDSCGLDENETLPAKGVYYQNVNDGDIVPEHDKVVLYFSSEEITIGENTDTSVIEAAVGNTDTQSKPGDDGNTHTYTIIPITFTNKSDYLVEYMRYQVLVVDANGKYSVNTSYLSEIPSGGSITSNTFFFESYSKDDVESVNITRVEVFDDTEIKKGGQLQIYDKEGKSLENILEITGHEECSNPDSIVSNFHAYMKNNVGINKKIGMKEATLYLYKNSKLVAIRDMTMAVWDEVLTETNKDFILSASEYHGEYDVFKIVIEGAYIETISDSMPTNIDGITVSTPQPVTQNSNKYSVDITNPTDKEVSVTLQIVVKNIQQQKDRTTEVCYKTIPANSTASVQFDAFDDERPEWFSDSGVRVNIICVSVTEP